MIIIPRKQEVVSGKILYRARYGWQASWLILFFLIILTCFDFSSTNAQTPTPPHEVRIIVETAKLRTGPGVTFPSNGFVEKGDVLVIYQISDNGDWLLVDQDFDLWISINQVEEIDYGHELKSDSATVTKDQHETNRDSATEDFEGIANTGINKPNILSQPSNPINRYFNIFIILSGVAVVIPLIFGFHWRWFIGSFFACLFWGPIGLIYAIYVVGLILVGSETISTCSPRELMEDFAESKIIVALIIISLIVLTAFSILGGLIVFGIIYFYYRFSLLFMPKGCEKEPYLNQTNQIDYHSSSNYDDSSNDGDNWRSYDDYDRDYDNHDDDDDDDDDNKGSAWDGWLVKW